MSGISGTISYVNWPSGENLFDLRLVVFKLYPPENIFEYGYNKYKNVIHSMEMDRLLAPTRPFHDILRPLDGKKPDNIPYSPNKNYKEFTPIQNHSGLGLGVYFCSPMNAVRFANKYFTPFDFNVPEKDIIENQGIKDIVFAYHAKEI